MAAGNNAKRGEGLGVDATGGPVVDPTKNVLDLFDAGSRRQDDLRAKDCEISDIQHRFQKELTEIRADHNAEIGQLRADNSERLRVSDLDRLDKTRQVDVLAGTASAAALATAVQTLANTSDRNAETLRNMVAATAQTIAKQAADQALVLSAQADSQFKDVNARIAELQKSSYTGAGKSAVSDPAMADLVLEMRKMAALTATSGGKSDGIDATWKLLIAGAGLLFAFLAYQTRTTTPAPVTPQVIMVPAPVIAPPTTTTTTTIPAPR